MLSANNLSIEQIHCYCALCISRCGSIAVVENGRFVALEPDPSHPTGQALCAKGRAAPELVYHPDRLLYPLKRTRPKGDPDPGWQRISWDEALDLTATRLRQLAEVHGPESVVFSQVSPSTSASADALVWIDRLRQAFGSPNLCVSMELCGWGRYLATAYTYGASVPGVYLPDLENAGCILFWGYNPNLARLSHATATVAASLATRLGLGSHFWDGDIETAYRTQLGPSGISLDALRQNPGGVRAQLQTRYRKFAEQKEDTIGGQHGRAQLSK